MNKLPQNRDQQKRAADATSRRLIRTVRQAALATRLTERDNWPFVSLVQTACDHAARPLLLLSDLAVHARNIATDDRVSLLYAKAGADPVAGARTTVIGHARRCDDERLRARFLARHHNAREFAAFADFHLYRVDVEAVHFIGGFGQIETLPGDSVTLADLADDALLDAEPDIVSHMNADHADAVQLYAHNIAGRPGINWRVSGVDPEGCDLHRFDSETRVEFAQRADTADAVRTQFVELARRARGES
jgi:putative heme iron utilization protein